MSMFDKESKLFLQYNLMILCKSITLLLITNPCSSSQMVLLAYDSLVLGIYPCKEISHIWNITLFAFKVVVDVKNHGLHYSFKD